MAMGGEEGAPAQPTPHEAAAAAAGRCGAIALVGPGPGEVLWAMWGGEMA